MTHDKKKKQEPSKRKLIHHNKSRQVFDFDKAVKGLMRQKQNYSEGDAQRIAGAIQAKYF